MPLRFDIGVTVEHFDGEGRLVSRQSTDDETVKVKDLEGLQQNLKRLEKRLRQILEEKLEKEKLIDVKEVGKDGRDE